MCRMYKEKIKSLILVVLLATSIIQVGILWHYQNHGLPIRFFMTIFGSSDLTSSKADDIARDKIFSPYRIVLSNGNESHWIVDRNSDLYNKLWDDGKEYLKDILGSKQPQQVLSSEAWGDLVIKKGVTFEFRSDIPLDLLKWFLNIQDVSGDEPAAMYKMIIVADNSTGQNSNTLYIKDNNNVYQYTGFRADSSLTSANFESILKKIDEDRNSNSREYSVIKELYNDKSYSPDILCVTRLPKTRRYNSINCSIPDKILDQEQIADIVLGNEQNSYGRYVNNNNTIVFKNLDSIYRIYSYGLLEYRYIPGNDISDKGSISAAFANAYRSINGIMKVLDSEGQIYLSNVRESRETNSYKFTFDYIIDDTPIFLNFESKGKDGNAIKNGIVVEATAKRVLKIDWMLKDFKYGKEKDNYNLDFVVNIDNAGAAGILSFPVKDAGVSYVIETDTAEELEPVWFVQKEDGSIHNVRLLR